MDEGEGLCGQLDTVDAALGALGLIVTAVALSYWATLRQRGALCLAIQGREAAAGRLGSVAPVRRAAATLVVGALVYFFWLAQRSWAEAEEGDRAGTWAELWASALVLAAAVIRWRALAKK